MNRGKDTALDEKFEAFDDILSGLDFDIYMARQKAVAQVERLKEMKEAMREVKESFKTLRAMACNAEKDTL